MEYPDLDRLRVTQRPSRLQSLTLQGILLQTKQPTAFFITISLIELGKDVLKEHLDHMTADLLEHPELKQHSGMATSYVALKRLVWLIQKVNQSIQRSTEMASESEEELTQSINWFSETLEQVARMYEACTDELMDAVVVCSITIYIHAASLPNVVPILSFEDKDSGAPLAADLVSIGKSVTDLAESMEGVYSLPIGWDREHTVYLPREEDMWKIWHFADKESKAIIGYELLRLGKTYVAVVEDNKFDNMATWALKAPELMSLCRKRNPFALLLYAYYLATTYFGLPLYDKLKRVEMDIVDVREQVPDSYKPHLDWPLEICFGERDRKVEYEMFLKGTLRRHFLRKGEVEGEVRGRPDEEMLLGEAAGVGLVAD
ncbi:hypothetical protein CJU90_5132 [Yarrowia sp. C11]|nr:hypothetical protein CJU90_5132 [Yarrowia sp. C11]KAG5364932.1 hypothetical protein CKK34_3760 [Yarrowia sp. E02]